VPLHLQEAYRHLGYKKGDFPVTEQVATRGLSLPMFPELTEDQIDYVVGSIKEFFQ
jgi:dTDP-4-amino-4,6-dideoxygalactose transaminase